MKKSLSQDYLYQSLLQNFGDAASIELFMDFAEDDRSLLLIPDLILQRLFRSKYYTLDQETVIPAYDIIYYILLHCPYITAGQLASLKLYSSELSARSTLSHKSSTRKNKKTERMLDCINIPNAPNESYSKAYSLSPYGRRTMAEKFPEIYLKNNHLDAEQTLNNGNIAHDVYLLNLFYKILPSRTFSDFSWRTGNPIPPRNTMDKSLEDSLSTCGADAKGLVKPDAVIRIYEDDIDTAIYVEQDMCSERASQLSEKFERYTTSLSLHDAGELCMLTSHVLPTQCHY